MFLQKISCLELRTSLLKVRNSRFCLPAISDGFKFSSTFATRVSPPVRSSFTHQSGTECQRFSRIVPVFGSSRNYSVTADKSKASSQDVIYKFRWIKTIRFISRVKILHVLVVSGLTGPLCLWYTQGTVPFSVFLASALAATATTGGLFALSYFFRRIVGVISVDQNNKTVTLSTLTFWGNRKNLTLPLSQIFPMSESGFDSKHLFHRLEIYGNDFVYLLNLRHGEIQDRSKLLSVIGVLHTTEDGSAIKTRTRTTTTKG